MFSTLLSSFNFNSWCRDYKSFFLIFFIWLLSMLTVVFCFKFQISFFFNIFDWFIKYVYHFCDHIRLILFSFFLLFRSNRFRLRILLCWNWKLFLNRKKVLNLHMRAKTIQMTHRIIQCYSIFQLKNVISINWIDYSLTSLNSKPFFSNLIWIIINFINTKKIIIIFQQYLEIKQTTLIVMKNICCSWNRIMTRKWKYS